jgi:hypothetical protein
MMGITLVACPRPQSNGATRILGFAAVIPWLMLFFSTFGLILY